MQHGVASACYELSDVLNGSYADSWFGISLKINVKLLRPV